MHREPRRKDAQPELAFRSGWHAGRAGAPRWAAALAGAVARGRSGGVGAASPATHRIAGESRRRCIRSSLGLVPAPEIPRLVLHAQPGLLGGGRGGARDGGGGGAPITAAAADPGSTHAPLGSGRWRTVPLPGPGEERGQNPDRLVLTVKPWGARALPLLHASAAVAGPAPRWDPSESPSGASACGVEAAPGTG